VCTGLQISSHVIDVPGRDPKLPPLLVTEFVPRPEHQSYPGVLNAGVVGSLLDCHGNWTTAMALMNHVGCNNPPTVVSAFHSIKLTKPVPYKEGHVVTISSVVEELLPDRCFVKMYLRTGDDAASRCAEGEGWYLSLSFALSFSFLLHPPQPPFPVVPNPPLAARISKQPPRLYTHARRVFLAGSCW
jgi:hypothetical protein